MLFALNGDGSCDEDHPQNPFTDDQFAGTPLAPVVAALETLADELATQAAAEEPDLAALTAAVDLSALANELDLLGVSDTTAYRYLQELEQEGHIRQVGKEGRGVYYQLK